MTPEQAINVVQDLIKDAWDADPVTASKPLQYDDVTDTKPVHAANGLPAAYGRVSIAILGTVTDTLGGAGVGQDLHEGRVVVQCFAPFNGGRRSAHRMAEVVALALRRRQVGALWTFESGERTPQREEGSPWARVDAVARFRFQQTT